jgi:dTDP-4-amino-4,6-dideoxygalactose transaminase
MQVAFFDLARRDAAVGLVTRNAMSQALASGQVVGGAFVERFEFEFAKYLGVKHCIATSNGLDSLRLILQSLGVGEGDEVLVPAQTFIATWLAVAQLGARPVPVDVDQFGLLDPDGVGDRLTSRTKAVIPVHLFGSPCDMDAIRKVLEGRSVALVEDAAQAHGAKYKGKLAGSLAEAAAFSFYPTKNLGAAGDAGAVVTNDDGIAAEVRSLRSYGAGASKYDHVRMGWNCRMDSVQAATLSAYLPYLDEWNGRRNKIAQAYDAVVSQYETRRVSRVAREDSPESINANHLYVLRSPRRDWLRERLLTLGVSTDIHYPVPPFRTPAFAGHVDLGSQALLNADDLATQALSLPLHPWLSDEEVAYTCDALAMALQHH